MGDTSTAVEARLALEKECSLKAQIVHDSKYDEHDRFATNASASGGERQRDQIRRGNETKRENR